MILSYQDILTAIESREIVISPFDKSAVGPCSIDLKLGDTFLVFHHGRLFRPNDRKAILRNSEVFTIDKDEAFLLSPNQFVLASTLEKISISKKYAATLEGKSSIARLGIVVQAAGLVNPGTGLKDPTTLTLEIAHQANSPVELVPGMPIIQIIFHQLTSESSVGYDDRETSSYRGLTSKPRV
ncbi:MAG: dCTP deaminase [Candidatus Hodarchaeota archaeon]